MRLNRKILILALFASLSLGSMAFAAPPKHDCKAAKDTFNMHCVMCHGPTGKGYPAIGTPNFTDPKFQASLTDAQMVEVITNGKKGKGTMPPFKGQLTHQQIVDLVHCVVRGFAPHHGAHK